MSTGNVTFTLETQPVALPSGVTFSHYSFEVLTLAGVALFGGQSTDGNLISEMNGLTPGTYLITITAVDTTGAQIGANVITQQFTVYDNTVYYQALVGVSIQNS